MSTDLIILLGLVAAVAIVAVLARRHWNGHASIQLFNGDRWGADWGGNGTTVTSS